MRDKKERAVILGLLPHLDSDRSWREDDVLWPDEANRETPDIDALAASTWAIEHTRLDTLPNQRRNDAWFLEVIDGLEQELSGQISCYLLVRLPYGPLTHKFDRRAIRAALRRWIQTQWAALPEGASVIRDASNVPFAFDVQKQNRTRPGLYFARNKPSDESLPRRLLDLLARKATKLRPYRQDGYTTVLLVENDNVALMGYGPFLETYGKAFGASSPPGINLVWYVDTHRGTGPDYFRVSGEPAS